MARYIGDINPFRYRGYVYDDERGLYYLQSRYYNPEWYFMLQGVDDMLIDIFNE